MIDVDNDELLSCKAAAKVAPKIDGKHPSPATVVRWIEKGVKGVRLEATKVGGRLVTTRDAVLAFLEQSLARRSSPAVAAASPSRKPRASAAHERARKRLKRSGF